MWFFRKWTNVYYVEKEVMDWKQYGEWNPFKKALRKIYRPLKYSKNEADIYDIFVLQKVDRIKKVRNYILVDLDDEPELLTNMRKQNEISTTNG